MNFYVPVSVTAVLAFLRTAVSIFCSAGLCLQHVLMHNDPGNGADNPVLSANDEKSVDKQRSQRVTPITMHVTFVWYHVIIDFC